MEPRKCKTKNKDSDKLEKKNNPVIIRKWEDCSRTKRNLKHGKWDLRTRYVDI